jgi:hypothetical protein
MYFSVIRGSKPMIEAQWYLECMVKTIPVMNLGKILCQQKQTVFKPENPAHFLSQLQSAVQVHLFNRYV